MKRPFAATVWREGKWYISQCLELDVASQGESEDEALANLKEAIELHFEKPPDISILNDFQATQVNYAVTGALIVGQRYTRGVITPDPELIAVANQALERWFKNYQRSRSFMGRT